MKSVVRWTFWHDEVYPETEWPISDEEEQDYNDAIIRKIKEKGYRITGFAHQGDRFCTPVFDDGRRYIASFRQWGGIMADALGIDCEYGYAVWAWSTPPEGLNLPKPSDWNESVESLKQQEQRWQADREREKQELIFEDTQQFYAQNTLLANAVQEAKLATKLYEVDDYPEIRRPADLEGEIVVSKYKSFEAAIKMHEENPLWKIAALNFASATNPGGGVKTGSSAQEESLCRCSTLYPTLTQGWLWNQYYQKNRDAHNNLHTDACIYSPGIVICKTDDAFPARLEEKDWVTLDVISCAAPNLRRRPSNSHNPEYGEAAKISQHDLYRLHLKRAVHIMHIAAARNVDALVLGAFGCGAFANDPNVVAKAYREAADGYMRYFRLIEFAVYCRADETENYDAFKRELSRLSSACI